MIQIGADVTEPGAGPSDILDMRESLQLVQGAAGRASGMPVLGGDGAAFGGQMVAQALLLAQAQVPDRLPQSVHAFFLAAVRPDEGIAHHAQLLKSGGAFTRVRVETHQQDRHCLSSIISLHGQEGSPEHQAPMPPVLPPERYPLCTTIPPGTHAAVRQCFEIRTVETQAAATDGVHPQQTCWMRYRRALPDETALHAAALVWFADLSMPWTTDLAYDARHGRRVGASLDHAVWFHRPFRADRWLLFVQESLVYAGARALSRGVFYTEDGVLVASAAQETLLRRIV